MVHSGRVAVAVANSRTIKMLVVLLLLAESATVSRASVGSSLQRDLGAISTAIDTPLGEWWSLEGFTRLPVTLTATSVISRPNLRQHNNLLLSVPWGTPCALPSSIATSALRFRTQTRNTHVF
jgi:hypothetical protein